MKIKQIKFLLQDYRDIFRNDNPVGLPLIWDIEHQIDFAHDASLPNQLAYRASTDETKEP